MTRFYRVVLAIVCLLAIYGCDALQKILRPETGPQQQTVLNVNVGMQPSPSPSPTLPGCTVSGIEITSDNGSIFPANTTVRLDATPNGTNGPLPAGCPVLPIAWSFDLNTADCQFQGAVDSYNPSLRCPTSGKVIVVATLAGVLQSGKGAFTVSP